MMHAETRQTRSHVNPFPHVTAQSKQRISIVHPASTYPRRRPGLPLAFPAHQHTTPPHAVSPSTHPFAPPEHAPPLPTPLTDRPRSILAFAGFVLQAILYLSDAAETYRWEGSRRV